MSRKEHDFDYKEKDKVRRKNIQWLTKNNLGMLIGRDGRLVCRWAELAGKNAYTLKLLLEKDLITEDQFIGVDVDATVINESQEQFPRATWVRQRWQDFAVGDNKDIGCANLDAYYAASEKDMKYCISQSLSLVERGYKQFGQFCFIVNGDLTWGRRFKKKELGVVVQDYCDFLREQFGRSAVLPDIEIEPSMVTIYRNSTGSHWMGNVCMLFR